MIRIKLTADRRILAIETDDIRVVLNGRSNIDYKNMLAPAGVVLEFESPPVELSKPTETRAEERAATSDEPDHGYSAT